ncbi:MAG: AAA family ATPase, partial [Desulfarculaceae bacterium]
MHLKRVTLKTKDYPTSKYYPFNLEILRQSKGLELKTPITFFVGENGSGKTTLLEAICHRCGIHIWRREEGRRYEINPFEGKLHHFLEVEWVDKPVPGSFFSSGVHEEFSRALDNWAAVDPGQLKYFGGKSL